MGAFKMSGALMAQAASLIDDFERMGMPLDKSPLEREALAWSLTATKFKKIARKMQAIGSGRKQIGDAKVANATARAAAAAALTIKKTVRMVGSKKAGAAWKKAQAAWKVKVDSEEADEIKKQMSRRKRRGDAIQSEEVEDQLKADAEFLKEQEAADAKRLKKIEKERALKEKMETEKGNANQVAQQSNRKSYPRAVKKQRLLDQELQSVQTSPDVIKDSNLGGVLPAQMAPVSQQAFAELQREAEEFANAEMLAKETAEIKVISVGVAVPVSFYVGMGIIFAVLHRRHASHSIVGLEPLLTT